MTRMIQFEHTHMHVYCNAPRLALQMPSMFFVIVVCIYLFVASHLIASCALHPHIFIKLVVVRSCRFSLCLC